MNFKQEIMYSDLQWVSNQAYWSPIRNIGLHRVSDAAYGSPIGLQSGMLVSNGFQIRHVGLEWVSDNNNKNLTGYSAKKI